MKTKQRSNLTVLAILTTLTLLTWVAVEAYQRFRTVDYGNIPPEVLATLSPNLDKNTFALIESKKSYSEEEISHFTPATSGPSTQVSPSPSSTSQSTQSAQIKPSVSPSPSAQSQ